eukprot:TRINITY_DN64758_c0_g2_i1.p1 TRINITY_DN64758_c0_g2~~TRINITY_DN64758_c0_g2_i1.p1  ORF type:complete len:414 (-),score=65.30 TRINITY_DN64758_c0_g2_i1:103-1344(-)
MAAFAFDDKGHERRVRQPAIQVSDEALQRPSHLSLALSKECARLHIQDLYSRTKEKRVRHVSHGSHAGPALAAERFMPQSSSMRRSMSGTSSATAAETASGGGDAQASADGREMDEERSLPKGDTTGLVEFVESPTVGAPKGCHGVAWIGGAWKHLKSMDTPRDRDGRPEAELTQLDTRVLVPARRHSKPQLLQNQRAVLAKEATSGHHEVDTRRNPSTQSAGRPPRPGDGTNGGYGSAAPQDALALPLEPRRRPASASSAGDEARRTRARPPPMLRGISGSSGTIASPSSASVLQSAVATLPAGALKRQEAAGETWAAGQVALRQRANSIGTPKAALQAAQASVGSTFGFSERLTPVSRDTPSSTRIRAPTLGARAGSCSAMARRAVVSDVFHMSGAAGRGGAVPVPTIMAP